MYNSNAFFRSCIFRGLSEQRLPENPLEWDARVGALHVVGLNATLALDNCTITNIVNPVPLVVSLGGLVYSDNPDHVVRLHHLQRDIIRSRIPTCRHVQLWQLCIVGEHTMTGIPRACATHRGLQVINNNLAYSGLYRSGIMLA